MKNELNSKKYGYARVSTRDQNEDRQMLALNEFGIQSVNIYVDKMSGKTFQRPEYRRLVGKLRAGDLLVVPSIDRLGRNYEEILSQWRMLTKERNVDIVVLDMPLLDTRKENKDLTGVFIGDLVLQILSYVAQCEREKIHQRQIEGIRAAHMRGVKFGRPRIKKPENFNEVAMRWRNKEISSRAAAAQLGVAQQTFLRWAK